jgi:hypothetical protein
VACFRLETASTSAGSAAWSASARGFDYRDPDRVNGACRAVRLKDGTLLDVRCRTSIPFRFTASPQGSIAARFISGAGEYCMVFGGAVTKDRPPSVSPRRAGVFSATSAPVPSACPSPPASCP